MKINVKRVLKTKKYLLDKRSFLATLNIKYVI